MTAVLSTPEIGFTVGQSFAERGRHIVLHEVTGGGCTPCLRPVYGTGFVIPANLAHRRPRWCGNGCWAGHTRCVVCGAPAGQESECGPCTKAAIDADKRIERAAA